VQVINFYLFLLIQRMERAGKEGAAVPKCHFFNSFFVTKLGEGGYNYAGVKRWSKKANVGSARCVIRARCPAGASIKTKGTRLCRSW
jgi:Ulp1 family protease